MKNQFRLLFPLIFLAFAQPMIAQAYKDCETALFVCDESPYQINATMGVGELDTNIDLTCVSFEFNSTWISWTVLQGGSLTFVLTPDSTDQDLDFVVFKLNTSDDCDDKEVVRCMASGQNVGAPPDTWEACTGQTGLAVGETDVEELPGCSKGDNNFLAPLETTQGEQYVMLVNNFSNTSFGFTLSFDGTAELDCETVSTSDEEDNSSASFVITPTVTAGNIAIDLKNENLQGAQIAIYTMTGQMVYSESSIDQPSSQIDLAHLASGAYFAILRKDNAISTQRFFILK